MGALSPSFLLCGDENAALNCDENANATLNCDAKAYGNAVAPDLDSLVLLAHHNSASDKVLVLPQHGRDGDSGHGMMSNTPCALRKFSPSIH